MTHVKSTEGVPEALITLQGPYSASSTSLYTPSSALTPDMREQIDILFKSAPAGISGAIVIDAARRMEAQFLGLPRLPSRPRAPLLNRQFLRSPAGRTRPGMSFLRIFLQGDIEFVRSTMAISARRLWAIHSGHRQPRRQHSRSTRLKASLRKFI
ncbi:MAG TPA: hypothetical protein VFE29_08465 [Terriglobia bacterium]|nr:hypothetical protein [Terriglobia bacterium]